MRSVLLLLFSAITIASHAQTVLVMDFVKIKNGKQAEALFFYENNWKLYRDIALEKGFITAYRLEKTTADSSASFDLVLITEYADSSMYRKSEDNFRAILSTARPNGPLLLNELQPADFRQNVFVKVTETLYSRTKKRKK
ncbi:MAG: hypothetical protein J0L56_11045 [Chitinophagales bacterium]|nr:hypothetical protein [Chitinophagales bacterium]